jgi:hypothetical protein
LDAINDLSPANPRKLGTVPKPALFFATRHPVLRVVDLQADFAGETDRNRFSRRVWGGLIRVKAPPCLDPGTIAIDRRQALSRHIVSGENIGSRMVRRRVKFPGRGATLNLGGLYGI